MGNRKQGKRAPPPWLHQHQYTNKRQRNYPPTPTSPNFPPNEPLQPPDDLYTSPYSQAVPLSGLPTPTSLNLSCATSPISSTEEYQLELLASASRGQENDDEDDDLYGLDFSERVVPLGAQCFPVLQIAEPLPFSMEIPGALGALQSAHTLPPRMSVSMYFRHLDDNTYYPNVCKKPEWNVVSRDPAFSFDHTSGHVVSFAELEANQMSIPKNMAAEESSIHSKFDIGYLYRHSHESTYGGLPQQQEAKLAALGVGGPEKPARSPAYPPATHFPAVRHRELPPWRRNEDSRYSRYFHAPP